MKYSEAVSLFLEMHGDELHQAAVANDKPFVTLIWNGYLDFLTDAYDVPYEASQDWLPPSMAALYSLIDQGEI